MVLRYYQNGGQIGSPNGTADPDTLNKYLTNCGTGCDGYVTNPDTGEQVVNLWRLSGFTGGATDISIEKSDPRVHPDAGCGRFSGTGVSGIDGQRRYRWEEPQWWPPAWRTTEA